MSGRAVPRRPRQGGGLAVLIVVTVLASLAAPHAQALQEMLAAGAMPGPSAGRPAAGAPAPAPAAARAVAFALGQLGKPYRWGAQGPHTFDCSGLTWAAWRAAGVAIPRTAAGQLAGLPRVRGRLQPGDLVIYRSRGPSRRHVAMVVGGGRMVEAPARGVPVRVTGLRGGFTGRGAAKWWPMIALAVWLAALPFRLLGWLGLRGSVILACLFVLAVTAYGVAQDLGLLDPPAAANLRRGRRRPAGPPPLTSPPGYLRLYRSAARRCRGLSWAVLAAVGKVESDHGRARLPGVRSGWNHAGAAGPMQFGIGVGRAGNAWARFGRDFDRDGQTSVYDPGDAIPAAAGYLCAHGAPRRLDAALVRLQPLLGLRGQGQAARPPLCRPRGWAAVRGRIALHLDKGLGWTAPLFVACCADCGTELARHPNQAAAARAAGRTRCPGLRHPDRPAAARHHQPDHRPRAGQRPRGGGPLAAGGRLTSAPTPPKEGCHPPPCPSSTSFLSSVRSSGRSPVMARGSTWQIDMGDGTWAVCCMACRLALYRGNKRTADRVFAGHRCEPVVPLSRRRRPA